MYSARDPDDIGRFFRGLTEHAFHARLGIVDPPLVDYVSLLLVRFIRNDDIRSLPHQAPALLDDVTDMLSAVQQAPAETTATSRPPPIQPSAAEADQAARLRPIQMAVPTRSCSGSTAHSETAPSITVDAITHQPMPPGPKATPEASETKAPKSLPTGTWLPQAATTNSDDSQPQAR